MSDEINPYAPPEAELAAPKAAKARVLPADWRRTMFRWTASLGGAGLVLGVLARLARPYMLEGSTHYDALLAIVLLVACSAAAVVRFWGYPLSAGQKAFQLALLALWTGFGVGWTIVHGEVWIDFVYVSAAWWFGCAVVGALLLLHGHVRPRIFG